MTEKRPIENANIGQLADDNLRQLTPLEELVRDLANERDVYDEQIRRASECVENAQENSNEILRRFEEQVEPIESVKVDHD